MADFSTARRMMVDGQIRTSDVTDLRIISAFQTVPRERFVRAVKDRAGLSRYRRSGRRGRDRARRMLKPMVLAKLIQAAEIAETDRVLIVGCTTGYSAAIIASLAGSVVALEEGVRGLLRLLKNLSALGVTNVEVVRGPLTAGWPAGAPYDVILIEGAIEVMPESFRAQLKEGGRLVCVRGHKPPAKAFAVPPDRGRTQRKADFRRHGPVAAGICREAGLRFLTELPIPLPQV